jgi:hypothetical protein
MTRMPCLNRIVSAGYSCGLIGGAAELDVDRQQFVAVSGNLADDAERVTTASTTRIWAKRRPMPTSSGRMQAQRLR